MTWDKSQPRLLLIALDAFPYALLDRWCANGTLPNLQRLREEGRSGLVASEAELYPGAIWPSFFTQSDASHHANYNTVQWDAATQRLRMPAPDWCDVDPFWRKLSRRGVPTIALDVPFSEVPYAPDNAVEVIGWGMHEGAWHSSNPRDLLRYLDKTHGHSSQVREGLDRTEEDIVAELSGLVADIPRRTAIIEDLARRFDWGLMVADYSEPHRAGHWFWGERGTGQAQGGLKLVVQAIDAMLPRLRKLLRPQDQLAFFSNHGMGPTYDMDRVGVAAMRYLEPKMEFSTARRLDPIHILRNHLPTDFVRSVTRRLPQSLFRFSYYHLMNAGRDWASIPTIINPLDHLIYVHANFEGDAAAKAEYLARVVQQFEGIHTPDGQSVVEMVVRPSEMLSGPRVRLLPDLIVKPMNRELGPTLIMADGRLVDVERFNARHGEHTAGGFYIQVGDGIEAGDTGPSVAGANLANFLMQPAGFET